MQGRKEERFLTLGLVNDEEEAAGDEEDGDAREVDEAEVDGALMEKRWSCPWRH
jgi:hypothetical protein